MTTDKPNIELYCRCCSAVTVHKYLGDQKKDNKVVFYVYNCQKKLPDGKVCNASATASPRDLSEILDGEGNMNEMRWWREQDSRA